MRLGSLWCGGAGTRSRIAVAAPNVEAGASEIAQQKANSENHANCGIIVIFDKESRAR